MILISSMYHQSGFQAVEQILNYNLFFKGNAIQVVHISKNSPPSLKESILERCSLLIDYGLLLLNPEQIETFPGTVMFQHISNLNYANQKAKFDFVYIHTSGDLICRGNPSEYIAHKKYGFSSFRLQESANWPHKKKALESSLFSGDDLYFGRAEGAFFKADFYNTVLNELENSPEFKRLLNPSYAWPIEEVIFSTKAVKFGIQPFGRNIIITKEVQHVNEQGYEAAKNHGLNTVNKNDLESLIKNPDKGVMGIKWFSTNPNDPARLYLKSILGE